MRSVRVSEDFYNREIDYRDAMKQFTPEEKVKFIKQKYNLTHGKGKKRRHGNKKKG